MKEYDWEYFDDWSADEYEDYFEPPGLDDFFYQQELEKEERLERELDWEEPVPFTAT